MQAGSAYSPILTRTIAVKSAIHEAAITECAVVKTHDGRPNTAMRADTRGKYDAMPHQAGVQTIAGRLNATAATNADAGRADATAENAGAGLRRPRPVRNDAPLRSRSCF